MAIANSYFNSSPITDSDIFVGTKYATNRTVNYTAQSIADYLNINSRISISGQLTFKFTILPNVAKTIAFENGGGDGRLFSSIDKLIVSILDAGGSNITVFLDYLIDSEILLAEQNQPNSFGHYKITSYTVTANPNFYELNLEYIGGNGNIYKDVYYDMTPWASSGGIGTTPNLQQVTDEGNTTTNGIIINSNNLLGQSFKVTDPLNSTSELYSEILTIISSNGTTSSYANGALTLGDLNLDITNLVNLSLINDTTNYGVGLLLNSSASLQDISLIYHPDYFIPQAPATSPSIFYIPYKLNGTYTLATLDDIPSYTIPTFQEVVTAGNIITTSFTHTDGITENLFFSEGIYASDLLNSTIIAYTFNGIYRTENSFQQEIVFAPVSGNKTITIPNATGTLALTSDIPTIGTWGGLNYPTWTTGTPFVKMTAAGTFALDTNTYLTSAVTSVGATSPLTSSGGNTPTISTSMATNKLIGRSTAGTGVMEEIAIGTGLTLTGGTLNASATGGIQHATASGTDTYTATIAGVTSYSDADAYLIRFTNGNTTSATLNINSLGAIPLYRNNDGVLIGGDIISGGEMLCVYNSTTNRFQVIGTAPNSLLAYVTNDDSVTLTKGMPVYAFSGTGDRMTVKRAFNTSDATSAQTVGLVLSTSIAANQKGFILMQGLLDGLSILPTATWSDGDAVYLGATAGTITNVKPYAPNHLVYLGVVTTASNGSAGRLYVRVQNGYELQELHNVDLISNTPTNNQLLTYESATSLWKNKNLTDILETFNRTQGIYFFDDFMGSLVANITNTTNGFVTSIGNGQGTLRSTSTITNRTNQQGVVEALTSANATGTAGYYYASGVYKGSGAISIETYINFTTLSVLAERFFSLFGFYTGVNYFNPPNCIAIAYDEGGSTIPFAGGTPNFRCITKGGSTVTNTITSVPVVAGQWYRLRINISNDGNTVTFFIDNALVATHTTNIPLNATFLPLGCMLQKTSGTAARAMQSDYFMYEEIFTTAR